MEGDALKAAAGRDWDGAASVDGAWVLQFARTPSTSCWKLHAQAKCQASFVIADALLIFLS